MGTFVTAIAGDQLGLQVFGDPGNFLGIFDNAAVGLLFGLRNITTVGQKSDLFSGHNEDAIGPGKTGQIANIRHVGKKHGRQTMLIKKLNGPIGPVLDHSD